MLSIVATPIGNLRDITLRALDTLKAADLIACEDTRVFSKLMATYGFSVPLCAYHEYNAEKVRPQILAKLQQNQEIALVSDAGLPLISDPGYKLLRDCQQKGISYTVIPGPSASLTALCLSGLPPDRFLFLGFLPSKSGARREALAKFRDIEVTLIFFESSRRLCKVLEDMHLIYGDRQASVCREMTKIYEEVKKGKISELLEYYKISPPKGEIVIVVEGKQESEVFDLESELKKVLSKHSTKEAATIVASRTGVPRKQVYAKALELLSCDENS